MSPHSPILVDTSVWIDFFSRHLGPAGNKLRSLIENDEPVALAGIIVTKILQGLTRDAERIASYLSQWGILEPEGLSTHVRAAELFRLARSRGLALTTVDALSDCRSRARLQRSALYPRSGFSMPHQTGST